MRSHSHDPDHTLYLVDISSFIFRAFFAIRSLSNSKGEPTNAVYGVATMLARLAEEAEPHYMAVVYDSKEPSFRKEIYTEYKANRSAPPDDLIPQFDRIEELVRTLGVHSYRMSGVEADDLIATLAKQWCKKSPKNEAIIVTGDKDLMQLVEKRVSVWDTMNGQFYGPKEVQAKYGVKPDQIRDFLALVGDSSDNIPGVPSIGPKTAVGLLQEYQDLTTVLKAAEAGKISGKKGEVLQSHKKDAELSAVLATLKEDLPVELDVNYLKYRFHVGPECVQLLKQLDFHTLVQKWSAYQDGAAPEWVSQKIPHHDLQAQPDLKSQLAAPPAPKEVQFKTVLTETDFEELLKEIQNSKEFGFDVETTSLNPRQAELVGIAICCDLNKAYYIPIGHRGTDQKQLPLKQVLKHLKPFLEDPKFKKVGQNLKYDWNVMFEQGVEPVGIGSDTMVAAYVLEPEGRHNLETLALQHLSYSVLNFEQVCGKGKDQIGFDQVPIDLATRYSAEDAWVAMKLWRTLQPKLAQDHLMEVFARVDLPLVEILAKMERQGVCIDDEWLAQLSKEFEKDLRRIEERIQAFAKAPINLNSPKQLGELLFNQLGLPTQGKTKTGYSTDAKVLEALAPMHEVPSLLLEYREISKLKGTYVDPLPGLRDPKTGKIHASFNQTVAATGRLSSSDPNLQNIPIRSERGKKIRRAFIPSQGNVLISADYSQIELRLLAHMSGDIELSRSFNENEDVHQRTASEIFAVKLSEVSDRQRSIAKAINFGLMYGKSAFGLAQELKISRKEAQDVIDRYFERYHGVKRYLDRTIIDAKEKGYTETLMGRRRHLPDIRSSNHAIRSNAERMAMNSPIQGTAADLIKIAMIDLDQALESKKLEAKLIIQVHDELVLDCPKKEADQVQKLVTDVMENAMKLSVPLRVNCSAGANWMEL